MCQYCEEPFDYLPVKGLAQEYRIQIVSVDFEPCVLRDNCESPASKWITYEEWDDGAACFIWFCPVCGRELPQD